jgi:hypothetical protein
LLPVGNFYTNFTLKTGDTERVAQVLKSGGRAAFVAGVGSYTLVFDKACDGQDSVVIEKAGKLLSSSVGCPALGVLNHDDDVLWYGLFEGGELVDDYLSNPGYFGGDEGAAQGGDAARLCRTFGAEARSADVESILHGDQDFTFAYERHEALVDALGLPAAAVGMGYTYLDQGETPDGIEATDFLRVG